MNRRTLAGRLALSLVAVLAGTWGPGASAGAEAPAPAPARAHSPLHRAPPQRARPPAGSSPGAQGADQPAAGSPLGYIPCDLWAAYGMGHPDASAGAGQTIAVIDPYDDPSLAADYSAFATALGLPAGGLAIDTHLGSDRSAPDYSAWHSEAALDIEWAHAMAPGARIAFIQARSSGSGDMVAAIDYAVGSFINADVVSMSWTFGEDEFTAGALQAMDAHLVPSNALGKSVVYTAAAGDAGQGITWPAESPRVVGIGGTSVSPAGFGYPSQPASHSTCAGATLAPGVNSANETVWGTGTPGAGTGGGVATKEAEPAFQQAFGIAAAGRAIPDVAMLADPASGVATVDGGFWQSASGGTSLGPPIWSGVIARLNVLRGQNNSGVGWLYQQPAAAYNDITTGSAPPSSGTGCVASPTASCSAGPGYDLVTGRGTVLFGHLQTSNANPVSFTYYFPWFDRASDPGFVNDNLHVVNPNPGDVRVTVHIPGCTDQTGTIAAAREGVFTCPGGFGGAVTVTADQPVLATQRVQYNQSFNEVRAVPAAAAAAHLVFAWFDLASDPGFVSDNIHVVNPAPADALVTVRIPGCGDQSATVRPGAEWIATCAGGFGGPVRVDSSQPVVATQRVKYNASFNEVAAQPAAGTGTVLLMSWFDRVSDPGFVSDNIHVMGPPGTRVHVAIASPAPGGCPEQVADLPPAGETYFTCAQGFGGPVRVWSDGAVPIAASGRVRYHDSFNEVAATPSAAASATVWISWFDLVSDPGFLADNIHVINPSGTGTATYAASIPPCAAQSGSLGPLQEAILSCPGGYGGPVRVSATTAGLPLLAASRVQYYSSFNEVPGSS